MTENNDKTTFKNNNLFKKLKAMLFKKKAIIISAVLFLICGLVGYITYSNYEYNKYISLAKTAIKNDNFNEAINNFKLAEKYNPEYDSDNDINNINNVDNIKNSKANYKMGIEAFNKKDYAKAVDELSGVVAKDKKRYIDASNKIDICEKEIVKSNLDLAKKYKQQKDYEKAIQYLSIASNTQPNNEEVNKLYNECSDAINKIKSDADAQAKAEQDAKDAQALVDEKAKAKTEGVKIGMTQQQVLDSSWGKPDQINKTTTAYGTNEQWVYGYNSSKMNFLYFENGILTSIQN